MRRTTEAVTSNRNANYAFSARIRNRNVNWNVWQISQKKKLDASVSTCQVSFVVLFQSNRNQKLYIHSLRNKCGHSPGDQSTPICRLYDIDGCDTQERNFTKRLMVKQCKCLPDCVSVSYDSLVTSLEQTYRWDSEEEWRNAQIENG